VAHEPLALEVDEGLERLGHGAGHGPSRVTEPQVDHVEHLDPEALQVRLDLPTQLLGSAATRPARPGSR